MSEVKENTSVPPSADEAKSENLQPEENKSKDQTSPTAAEPSPEVKEDTAAEASPPEEEAEENSTSKQNGVEEAADLTDPISTGSSESDDDVPFQNITLEDKLEKLLNNIQLGLNDDEDALMPELETSTLEGESSGSAAASSLPEIESFRHKVEAAKMAETKQNKQHVKKEKKRRETASSIEALSMALKSMPIEQQVATLFSKYAELVDDNKKLQDAVKTVQRQAQLVAKEKDMMETEHSKIILTKARLESLCRELQRQNKTIKDENMLRLREEEERRKEVSAKFNTTLSEISNLMKENSDKNTQLRDENQNMAARLQDLIKQYENRESHVEKMLKQKDLQCQLAEAKMAKQQIEVTEDKEKMLLEKKSLLEEISAYQQKTQQMSMTEITLRTQLNSYMEKYEEFTSALDKSNKVFSTFKEEIDMMAKKIKKLEKETKTWKERWEGANKALLDMVAERAEFEKKLETQTRQNNKLQGLCRALQKEVTELRSKEKGTSSDKEDDRRLEEKFEELKVEATAETNVEEAGKSTDENSSSDKPVDEAANKPVEEPADKPVEEPADKPVVEPADKPTTGSTEKPEADNDPLVSNFEDVD
ncbi:alpha-taxilin-like [Penaeus chinensis]|uniref:alpha-taxilin-like n=1 Tax=Penaeus chinensis TaxID=139456 RepID=UPI001FB5D04E|nr:alpha-taxilin-like [Penaeus chinensis]